MEGLDAWIAGLGEGAGLTVGLVVATLLGFRHATDPDHLTAVSSLVVADDRRGARRAAGLGLAWGLGHGSTLLAAGVPAVVLGGRLPSALHEIAEVAVGCLVALLALRLLLRWRRGYFHIHTHRHGDVVHAHPHVHEHPRSVCHPETHEHAHGDVLGRTPLAAFGVGTLHGIGGSAAIAIVLTSAVSSGVAAAAVLVAFALAAAGSMAVVSATFGWALARDPVRRQLIRLVPVLGATTLAFGVWYAAAAV